MILAPEHTEAVAAALATEQALTPEQIAAVAAELANDPEGVGYDGLDERETLILLSRRVPGPNPEPCPRVPRDEWATDELANALLAMPGPGGIPLLIAVESMSKAQDATGVLCRTFLAALSHLKSLSLSNPMVAGGLAKFLQGSLITQAQYDELTTMPDPAWSPIADLPSPLERIGFPQGAVLTLDELRAAK